jgi:hypothetical protein
MYRLLDKIARSFRGIATSFPTAPLSRSSSVMPLLPSSSRPNFALFLAQTIDIVCSGGVGLSTGWA